MVRPTTTTADAVAGDLRVAMAADWGTGLYGAPKIAEAIRRMAGQRKFDLRCTSATSTTRAPRRKSRSAS